MKIFCEYIIISMNGNCKHLYELIHNDECTHSGQNCNIEEYEIEELMEEKTLEHLKLNPKDRLILNYDFRNDWEFNIEIISVTDEYCKKM